MRLTRHEAEQVLVIDQRPEVPVYHARGDGWFDRELQRYVWFTRCGVNVGAFDLWLKRVFARKFCRPCRRCWP